MKTSLKPIECRNLTFRYRGGTRATDDVTFSLCSGDLLCLLGPNGAGKTTLIKQIIGDLRPTTGSVRIFGEDPCAPRAEIKRRMGIIPQSASLFENLSVIVHLNSFAALKGIARKQRPAAVERVIEECGLREMLAKPAGSLSGGQQRSVLFALALLADPEILILDEPTVGLDPIARRTVWKTVDDQKRRGKTIVLTTHYLEEAERLANRIGFVSGGALTHESPLDEFYERMGQCVRLVETPDAGSDQAGNVHVMDTVEEAEAFARLHRLKSYSIGRVSLEDVYVRLAGHRAPLHGENA